MGATAPDERTAESASLARGSPTETAQPSPRASDPDPEGRRTGDPRQGLTLTRRTRQPVAAGRAWPSWGESRVLRHAGRALFSPSPTAHLGGGRKRERMRRTIRRTTRLTTVLLLTLAVLSAVLLAGCASGGLEPAREARIGRRRPYRQYAAGAQRNLQQEIPHWDFEAVRQQAEALWAQELGKISVQDPDTSKLIKAANMPLSIAA